MNNPKTPHFEVLGIGAPCIDHILKVSDEFLERIPGKKEGMEVVDYSTFTNILSQSHVKSTLVAGGSCCNAIKGLANLGRVCAIEGKIGDDPVARYFFKVMLEHQIIPLFVETKGPTTQVACLVNPAGQRTCRVHLGAGKDFRADELDPAHFEGVKLVHIEGYTLLNELLTERAMELAKKAGAKVSFDAGSFEIVGRYKEQMISLIKGYVDVLFANQKEVRALTGCSSEKEGCELLSQICLVAVVMMGKEGCLVGKNSSIIHCPAYKVHAIDTTGAGDLFASGFLHKYLNGASLSECADLGAYVAAQVVQTLGAEIAPVVWEKIRSKFSLNKVSFG